MYTSKAFQGALSATSLLMLISANPLQAQTVAGKNADAGLMLEEIVVTAQRRAEDLQKTPIAVTALSAAALEDHNVRTTQDLMQIVPSLQVSTRTAGDGSNSATFFLRGFGQQTQLNGSQPAVGVYIDDFYYPAPDGSIFSIMDIAQVEVLRGPQGTLFGRNTIGGAIRYTTKKPDENFGGSVATTLGSFGRNDVSASINVPVGSMFAARLTAGRLASDGFVKRTLTGGHAGGGNSQVERLQLRVKPSSDLTIDLEGQYTRSFVDGFAYTLPGPFQGSTPGGPVYAWNNFNPVGRANPYDARYTSTCDYCQPGATDKSTVRGRGTNAVVTWQLNSNITLKSLTGYQEVKSEARVDLDGTPVPIQDINNRFSTRAGSQEFQLNGRAFGDALKWTSGLYYYDSTFINSGINGVQLTIVGNPVPDSDVRRFTKNVAGYVDATWAATTQLSVLGGFRYSQDRQRILAIQRGAGAPGGTDHATFGSSTGRIGAQYQWTDDLMTYLTVSQGFRSGGFNRLSTGVLEPFKPETDTTYEIGSRMTLWNGRLRINPTVFYNKWNDIQIQKVESNGAIVRFLNAAKAHTYGFELESIVAITKAFNVNAHWATLQAKYDDVGGLLNITTSSIFQRAPKYSGGLGLSYTVDLSDAGSVTESVDHSWQAGQASTPTNGGVGPDSLFLPPYQLTNARVEYKSSDKKWSVAGAATNLSNKTYYVGGVDYALTTRHFDLGRPREYTLSARYNF